MTSSQKIIEYLKNRLGDNLKLLFTPYKRDMWDSLEGVYKEAIKEGWKADVMPLPYTYRDKDGNFTEWIRDDWRDIKNLRYDMPEKDEYDAILFHNPYDQCNKVTSVKPEYYSDNFIGLGLLCLVPYGIGIRGIIRPGVLSADVCFIEFEETVESIIEDGIRAGMNENQIKFLRDKFVVVGSPKMDLDLDQTIPKEWESKIKGKRVVLVGTSLVPLLSDPMGELKKYDKLLNELTSKDQIVIWREHPLTLGTIRAMIPDYEYFYSVIKRDFIAKDNAIMDETNDYRKAFSVADVLYSVPSSLISVWSVTGRELYII